MLSEKRVQVIDITKEVRDRVLAADIVFVNSRHTTCGLFINEFQSALIAGLQAMLEQLVPENGRYGHNDPRYSDCERVMRRPIYVPVCSAMALMEWCGWGGSSRSSWPNWMVRGHETSTSR